MPHSKAIPAEIQRLIDAVMRAFAARQVPAVVVLPSDDLEAAKELLERAKADARKKLEPPP